MSTQTSSRPVGVDELKRAWQALNAGEFRTGPGAGKGPRGRGTAAEDDWTPADGEHTIAVIGSAGSVGASTVALATGPRVTSAKDIQKIIETVRKQGYAMTINSINSSFAAVAAPVFDYSGRIVATMTVLGSDKQLAGPRKKPTIDALLAAAHRLSERLGAPGRGTKSKHDDTPPVAPKPTRAKSAAGR